MTSSLKLRLFAFACISISSNLADRGFASNAAGSLHPMPVTTPNRSVYLNGVDISSARNQDLRNVHIKITENGDIFVSAPQYQVTEEETFMPLSSYSSKNGAPEHKPPQSLRDTASPINPRNSDRSGAESARSGLLKSEAPATPALSQPASNAAPKSGG
jgi:hypothetical protein